jgi:hypothetical protein
MIERSGEQKRVGSRMRFLLPQAIGSAKHKGTAKGEISGSG